MGAGPSEASSELIEGSLLRLSKEFPRTVRRCEPAIAPAPVGADRVLVPTTAVRIRDQATMIGSCGP